MFENVISSVTQTEIIIPTHEMLLLLVIMTICMLFRAVRIGLFVAFLFVYRWGWFFFRETFSEAQFGFFVLYCIFGFVALALAGIRMRNSSFEPN